MNTCPVSGLSIKTYPEWEDIQLTEIYSVSFMLLGKNIILSLPRGNSEGVGMERFLDCRREFLKYMGLYETEHIELKDYSGLKGRISKSNRIIFTDSLMEEQERGYLLGLFAYNGPAFIRWTLELGKKVHPSNFPLVFCKDYGIAVSKALSLFENKNLPSRVNIIDEHDEINNLLYFISELSWDLEDSSIPEIKLKENNPYKKLYEALALIKMDYGDIIEKQKLAEAQLQKSYNKIEKTVDERTIKLREQGAILETSLDILSHDTKNHFISLKYEIDQVGDQKLKSSINDSVTDIQELITEATGIMSSKKRIISIVELMEDIKVTSKRIPLIEHDRIKVNFVSPEFLFVQTSALFKNAVSNLIENALKYTGEENDVRIVVEKDQEIIISIIDSGIGIPDEEKKRIFKKFYRREETVKIEGSGRGLWITNNIIQQEGGSLSITDNPTGGAIFCIHLPPYRVEDFDAMLNEMSVWFEMPMDRIKGKAESYRTLYTLQGRDDISHMDSAVFTTVLTDIRKERKEEKKAFISARLKNLTGRNPEGKSIIITDDSLYVQFYLSKYFNDLRFNVIDYVDNGESAVISYKKRNPSYISLDNNMNIKTGPDAAEEIYAYDENAKIIFITAMGDSQFFRADLKKRFPTRDYRILTKPVYKNDIESLIEDF